MSERGKVTTSQNLLDGLPPSAKLVYKTLEYHGSLTQIELSKKTRLAPRTTRYALNQLEEREIITKRPCLRDARKRIYSLSSE